MRDRLYTLNSWLRVRGNNSFYNMEYIRSNGKTHNTYRDTVQKVAELAKEYGLGMVLTFDSLFFG